MTKGAAADLEQDKYIIIRRNAVSASEMEVVLNGLNVHSQLLLSTPLNCKYFNGPGGKSRVSEEKTGGAESQETNIQLPKYAFRDRHVPF